MNKCSKCVLKVMVWVVIDWDGITGTYFFFDGKTVTVDQINYCQMLEKFYLPELC